MLTGTQNNSDFLGAAPWNDVLDDELKALLARRQPRPLLGQRPALIAVDLYDLVYDGGPRPVTELMEQYPASCGEFAWAALPATIALFEAARALQVPIVHVNYDNRPETDPRNIHPTNRKRRQSNLQLYKIKDELTAAEGELVIYKKRASAFFGTPLCAFLNEMQVDSLLFVGESTSGCLRSSVVEGWSYGYPCVVVADGVYDRFALNHKVNLLDLHLKYATVVDLAFACEAMQRSKSSKGAQ
ncbi:isochorismatase family protein [Microbacteriaceae bacterium K1510]|nr:isochorismatase family protein [Microbacteriaceae bacterium K1510]